MTTRKKTSSIDLLLNAATNTKVTRGSMSDVTTPRERTLDSSVVNSSVFDKGGTADPAGQYWTNLLSGLGERFGIGQSDLVDFFSSIGLPTGHDISDAQLTDLNKQFVDSLLAAASEQDARNYNQQMLADQRLYDNPQNQLARLMGAGISRDAAIQMLSGSGGSGSGGVVTGQAAAMPAGIPATQSDLNDIQRKTSIAQTVFGGVSAVANLVSLGVSIPSAVAQATALNANAAMSQKALLGLQAADAVMSAFENAVEVGALTTKDIDGFSNGTDALNYMFDHKETNAFRDVFSNGSFAQVYGTKLGREMFANLWKNVRSSKDDGTILDNYIQSQRLQNALSGLEADKIGAELVKIGTETSAIEQSIIESITRVAEMNANIEVLNKQGEWISIQSEYMPDIWQGEAASLDIQNKINTDIFDINHAGVPILKQKYIDECQFAAFHAATLNSKEMRDKYWAAWLQNADNAICAAYVQNLYFGGVGDFAVQHPNLWRLCMGMSYSGAFDGIRAGSEAVGAGAAATGAAAGLIKAFKYVPK